MIEITYLYTLNDPETGEVKYIGITYDFHKRGICHLSTASKTPKENWIRDLKKRNLKPAMNIVAEYLDREAAKTEEADLIKQYKAEGKQLLNTVYFGKKRKRVMPVFLPEKYRSVKGVERYLKTKPNATREQLMYSLSKHYQQRARYA